MLEKGQGCGKQSFCPFLPPLACASPLPPPQSGVFSEFNTNIEFIVVYSYAVAFFKGPLARRPLKKALTSCMLSFFAMHCARKGMQQDALLSYFLKSC